MAVRRSPSPMSSVATLPWVRGASATTVCGAGGGGWLKPPLKARKAASPAATMATSTSRIRETLIGILHSTRTEFTRYGMAYIAAQRVKTWLTDALQLRLTEYCSMLLLRGLIASCAIRPTVSQAD